MTEANPFEDINVPAGGYGTIVADPPWNYNDDRAIHDSDGTKRSGVDSKYSTLSRQDILELPVADLAADNAHLYLWATNPLMFDQPTPADIAEAWGFTYKTMITWVKGERTGMGFYYRVDTEHALFCTRGTASIPGEDRQSNVIWSPRTRHSAKPDAFGDLVERVSPGPHLELFCRRPRFGWDSWGKGYETDRSSTT